MPVAGATGMTSGEMPSQSDWNQKQQHVFALRHQGWFLRTNTIAFAQRIGTGMGAGTFSVLYPAGTWNSAGSGSLLWTFVSE